MITTRKRIEWLVAEYVVAMRPGTGRNLALYEGI